MHELGIDDDTDTLARWMAHYIAEKIQSAESAPESEQDQKQSACCHEILKLWSHRNSLPLRRRPLESFAPIFKTLETLEPHRPVRRYFLDSTTESESEQTRFWLDTARQIDNAARELIRYCLANAAEEALNQESEWVSAARQAVAMTDDDLRLINMLADIAGEQAPQLPTEIKIAQLNSLLNNTEELIALLKDLSIRWREQIREINPDQ
ncbi:MAG: hypothetical protein K2Z81_06165 [Cyanobacteria bacterium]|nr:hypothetical protein [Cyanobacteriota bacterium]